MLSDGLPLPIVLVTDSPIYPRTPFRDRDPTPQTRAGGALMSKGKKRKNGHRNAAAHGKTSRAVQASERLYRPLFENMIDGYAHCRMLYDKEGKPEDFVYLYVNPAFERLTGLTDVVGKRVSELIPGIRQTNPELFEMYGRAALQGERSRFETYIEGLGIWLSIAVYRSRKHHFVAVFEDITEHMRLQDRLRLTQVSVDRAADLIHWIAPDGRLLYVSDSNCERHGYSREEMLGMSILDLDPSMSPAAWPEHWRQLKERGSLSFETIHKTKGGELFPIEVTANYVEQDGREYNFAFARDISERKRSESEFREAKEATERANAELLETQRNLELLARTDALTGTMNSRAILERLTQELARAERHGTSLAIAMIDIDHFKDVNDTYGHGVGDRVLREVVLRASEALRPYDGFGRFGGDEFLAVLPQASGSQIMPALERVRLAICTAPVKVSHYEVSVAVSIGAELDCGGCLDDVIRSADAALYQAKAEGRNRLVRASRSCATEDEPERTTD
jgi:diguanylate cyclase (GGDEF)-like protein/PAS domain S-box-containing protein